MINWLKKAPHRPSDPSEACQALKETGDEMMEQSHYSDAAARYREVLALCPAYAEASVNLANALLELHEMPEAELALRQAIANKPELLFAHFNLATLLLEQDRLDESIAHFRKALVLDNNAAYIYPGLCHALFRAGQVEDALKVATQGLVISPNSAVLYNFIGNLYYQLQRFDEAIRSYQKALQLQPDYPQASIGLSKLYQNQNQSENAIICLQQALQLQPNHSDLILELAWLMHQSKRMEEASLLYQKSIQLHPDYAPAYIFLGAIQQAQQDISSAMENYSKAFELDPGAVEALNNLGGIHKEQGKLDEAIACYTQALGIKPESAILLCNLGLTYKSCGETGKAMEYFQTALRYQPDNAEAWCYMGNMYSELHHAQDANTCFTRALELNPRSPIALYGLGALCALQQNPSDAISYLYSAIEIEPDNFTAKSLLMHQLQHICQWDNMNEQSIEICTALSSTPLNEKNMIAPLMILAMPGTSAKIQKSGAERWVHTELKSMPELQSKIDFNFSRPVKDKIHIAYLSGDFHDHPVSYLLAEVIEQHDRTRFHVTAYSYNRSRQGQMYQRLEQAFDEFVDICDLSFEESARRIHADNIDILIDLAGHTHNSRSGIMALRPAPVQVNYLGYPGTMGADFVDYIIADRYIIPDNLQQFYTEKVAYLPDCFQANDRKRPLPSAPARANCGLPESGIVFCCFNQTLKITPDMFDIWCRLLLAVPGSVLWITASNPQAEHNLRKEMSLRNVDTSRLLMATVLPREAHLARLQCADMFLDTLPFNAGTTCSDALWMGLPVITCAGEAFASRMAGSLLTALGVPELITYNLDDYYHLALDLATNRSKLAAIHNKIIANRDTAPLFDSERFTHNLEKTYIHMMNECSSILTLSINPTQ